MPTTTDPAEGYTNNFIELNVLEAALSWDEVALRHLLGRMMAGERRALEEAFSRVTDVMDDVPPLEL